MGFWSSLFGGSNSTLNSDMNKFGQIGGFATGLGEKNLSQASNFWSSILSGDQSKTSKVLAPQINNIQQGSQQQKQGLAQFGSRSGGTNASAQQIGDKSRASINNMVSGLMSSSASSLGSSGSGLLSQGASAYGQQADASQTQMQNWSNSLLGLGVTKGIGGAEGAAMSALGM